MEIHLIRHTTPAIDKNICYGQSDIQLTNTFIDEACSVVNKLPRYVDAIYTSPLVRCTLLADEISKTINIPVQKDSRLKELNFGSWEMQRWDDINQHDLMVWMNNYETERCPQGESYLDLVARLQEFLTGVKQTTYRSILVVTHGGVIKTYNSLLNNVSLKDSMVLKVDYGSIFTVNV